MNRLLQLLTDTRSELPVLRKHGSTSTADTIERLINDVAEAAAPFLEYFSEQQAMLASGKSKAWLRSRFAEWERRGLARTVRGQREYLKVVVPSSIDLDAVQADAILEARRDA